jgi:glycosyltransferase involved in cell wall biosynthesis
LRILFLTPHFPSSHHITDGIYNLSRAKALRALGCEVKIIAPIDLTPPLSLFSFKPTPKSPIKYWRNLNQICDVENIHGFEVFHPKWYRLPRWLSWKLELDFLHIFAGKTIDKVVRDFEPNLIISSGLHPHGTYAYYLKQKYDLAFFSVSEGSDILLSPDVYRGWNRIEKIINEYCDLVICVSEQMKKDIELKRNLVKVKLVRNGYEHRLFCFEPNPVRKPKERIDLVSVGNHNPEKGHDVLLKAMKFLHGQYHLTVIGNGPLSKEYEEFVYLNGLGRRVTFIGQIAHNHLGALLRNKDIFCMPSRSEGLPAAPLEAMACGLPVVASRVGGLTEIIIESFNGFFFNHESPEELCNIIEKTARTEWDRQEIANWARQNHSWDRWANDIISTYYEAKTK